jgi:hypothetical protein
MTQKNDGPQGTPNAPKPEGTQSLTQSTEPESPTQAWTRSVLESLRRSRPEIALFEPEPSS